MVVRKTAHEWVYARLSIHGTHGNGSNSNDGSGDRRGKAQKARQVVVHGWMGRGDRARANQFSLDSAARPQAC